MPTVSQAGLFNLQNFTSLGALAAGYRVYTYTQGTTTHKDAYTEATGSTVHTYTSDGAGGQYIAVSSANPGEFMSLAEPEGVGIA